MKRCSSCVTNEADYSLTYTDGLLQKGYICQTCVNEAKFNKSLFVLIPLKKEI